MRHEHVVGVIVCSFADWGYLTEMQFGWFGAIGRCKRLCDWYAQGLIYLDLNAKWPGLGAVGVLLSSECVAISGLQVPAVLLGCEDHVGYMAWELGDLCSFCPKECPSVLSLIWQEHIQGSCLHKDVEDGLHWDIQLMFVCHWWVGICPLSWQIYLCNAKFFSDGVIFVG